MTPEEAQKVADIVSTADNGCSVCVRELMDRLNQSFPEFRWDRDGTRMEVPYDADDPSFGARAYYRVKATPK